MVYTQKVKREIMGCPCYSFSSELEVKELIKDIVQSGNGGYSVAINAEKINLFSKSNKVKEVIGNSILPVADGAGAVLGLKLLYKIKSIKVDLPRLALETVNENKLKLFLFGSSKEVNAIATEKVREKYPNSIIVGSRDGYFENEEDVIKQIEEAKPDIVLVALGSPKQELFSAKVNERDHKILFIGCGGALDILAGKIKRAPKFFVENNLEWFYRLAKQPNRIKRQKVLPIFLFKLLYTYFFVTK